MSQQKLNSPIIICGRPRSGTRVVAKLLADNGVHLGSVLDPASYDAIEWWNNFTASAIAHPRLVPDHNGYRSPSQMRILRDIARGLAPNEVAPTPWGFKCCEAIFVIRELKQIYPTARFIHVIRDPRDVIVSLWGYFQLTDGREPRSWAPREIFDQRTSYLDFCRIVTFGQQPANQWHRAASALPCELAPIRFEVQAQAWVMSVATARSFGKDMGEDYFELIYDWYCREPYQEAERLFLWIGTPLYSVERPRLDYIGNWRQFRLSLCDKASFGAAVEMVRPMMAACGYVE